VDAPGKDGNASMPGQVKRPKSWRKLMMISEFGGRCGWDVTGDTNND